MGELNYHQGLSDRLESLVSQPFCMFRKKELTRAQATSGDFPHILFYGPSGAGKKTRIACTLREIFGPGVEKVSVPTSKPDPKLTCLELKIDQRVFLSPSRRKLEINLVQSNYHIEITPRCVLVQLANTDYLLNILQRSRKL